MIGETEHEKLASMLLEKKFFGGWTLDGTELVLWEHEQDPPKPLTRPKP
jgi:hypothetical protein